MKIGEKIPEFIGAADRRGLKKEQKNKISP